MLPILLAVMFVVILLAVVIAGRPDEFAVSRSITIAAPVEQVFPLVNELRRWEAWNPWGKLDPNCQMNYEGPPAGTGASYTWSGNGKVGAGRNTIVESKPGELVRLRLDFLKPMEQISQAEFRFAEDGGRTIVTWTMAGRTNAFMKLFGLFMNCDKMLASQFEKGLAQMKATAEAKRAEAAITA